MKWIVLLAVFSLPHAWAASCDEETGCRVLQCELERDIAEALRQGQPTRAEDMQATLARHRQNCTDASRSIKDTPNDQVTNRQQELQDAKDADNPVKEQKKKLRLDEEMAELEKLRTPGTTP